MIENPPLLTIHRGHRRPDRTLIEAFRGALTSHLVDAMEGRGAVDWRLNMSPLKNAEQTTQGVAIVLDDLTERKRLEAQRKLFERMVHGHIQNISNGIFIAEQNLQSFTIEAFAMTNIARHIHIRQELHFNA